MDSTNKEPPLCVQVSPFSSGEHGGRATFNLAVVSAAIRCRTKFDTFSLSALTDVSCSIVTITVMFRLSLTLYLKEKFVTLVKY